MSSNSPGSSSSPGSSRNPPTTLVARLRAAGCVFAEDEARLLVATAATADELDRMTAQRVAGLPLELVLGWVEFCGRRFAVEPGVFVPRRRTEFLTREAVACCRDGAVVVDLCCGSGAIGAVVAAACTGVELWAVDVDVRAVACACRNLDGVGTVVCGDLDAPLPTALQGRVDVLVANVPYVPTAALSGLPPEARLYEPQVALDGGADGLDVLRRVAARAPLWLAPGGHFLAEVDELQADAALAALDSAGLAGELRAAPEGTTTVIVGRRRDSGQGSGST